MKLEYRPEIDGLRGIAVLAVIFYHAKFNIFNTVLFKGGFIGVDIFFVISGFLITSIILKEIKTTGSFSFLNFYKRRARRILPMLILVMVFSIPFFWIYLLPISLIDFSKSILYSLGFSSNFYFYYSGLQYGAENNLLKPLLHTWSLSIEEQYYFFFPVILLIINRYFRKYLIYILVLSFIASLGIADRMSNDNPAISFYFLHTRIWELLAGSILAYLEIKQVYKIDNRIINLTLPSLGFFIIILNIFFFKLHFPHPSIYTLPSVIGTCLIIFFTRIKNSEFIYKLLSSKLMVNIGLISYSLYLWHFPIFAFAKINGFFDDDIYKIILLIIIFLITIISYLLVENPIRNGKYKSNIVVGVFSIFIFLLIYINYTIKINDGYRNRLPELYANTLNQENTFGNLDHLFKLTNAQGEVCFDNLNGCNFNQASGKKIYLIGDSHLASLIYDLKDKIVIKNYQIITYIIGDCFYFPNFNLVSLKTKKIDEKCNNKYFQKIKKILSNEKNSIIIFSGRLPLYLSGKLYNNQEGGIEGNEWENTYISSNKQESLNSSFKDEILKLSKNNKIILIYPIPEVGFNPNQKIFAEWINRKIFFDNFNFNYMTTSYKVFKDRTKLSFELLDSINNKNIYRVYPHEAFCDTKIQGRCLTHDEKNILYSDLNHPSIEGSKLINKLLLDKIDIIDKILNKKLLLIK